MIAMQRSTRSLLLPDALICAVVSTVHAHDTYRITSVGPGPADPDYRIIYANGMNDKGEVVGAVYGTYIGWVWKNGHFTYLDTLPNAPADAYSEPFAINNESVVAGVSLNSEGRQRPVLWRNGDIRELGALPDERSVLLYDINERGDIAGDLYSDVYGISGGIVVFGDQGRTLPALAGGDGYTLAARINECGVVAGTSSSAKGLRGVIWTPTGVHDLGTLPGADQVGAGEINDLGAVAMGLRYPTSTGGYRYRGAVWQGGHITELPLLHTSNCVDTYATGINNRGQVAGGTYVTTLVDPTTVTAEQYAVVWQNGRAFDVNDLICSEDPLKPYVTFVWCQDINNNGQILAQGRDSRAEGGFGLYLLTPVTSHPDGTIPSRIA